jgi:hypothetical protein
MILVNFKVLKLILVSDIKEISSAVFELLYTEGKTKGSGENNG